MGRDEMRAADADRQAVAHRLREAVDEGRLDLYEYDERLQRAYAARTYGELDPLLADLPTPVRADRLRLAPVVGTDAVLRPVGAVAGGPGATRQWLAETWGTYLRVVAVCAALWLALDWPPGFWVLVWVAGPYGAVLLVQTVCGLTSGEPRRWAAERRQRRLAARGRRLTKKPRRAGDDHPREAAGSDCRAGAAG